VFLEVRKEERGGRLKGPNQVSSSGVLELQSEELPISGA
jgi:hypothetical protein